MATEKELQLDAVEEPKSKKKLIIIIVIAVLVIAIGVAAALFLMGGDDAAEDAETEEAVAEEETEPSLGPAIYIKLKPEFIVNYQVGPRQRYLQIYMEAMTRDPAIAEALEMHSPMIRSSIISLLSQQSYEHLRTAEGRADVRIKLQEEIQRLLTQETGIEGGLEQVLFTNYVMQ
ncbi:MAG: flagellar basal body-associated FliL family protein [Bermanella sp.]|tara:strand:- start:1719 stop:2243 length:525 start_codon:yes stop_codon:yes gene_type:complete